MKWSANSSARSLSELWLGSRLSFFTPVSSFNISCRFFMLFLYLLFLSYSLIWPASPFECDYFYTFWIHCTGVSRNTSSRFFPCFSVSYVHTLHLQNTKTCHPIHLSWSPFQADVTERCSWLMFQIEMLGHLRNCCQFH